MKAPTQRLLPAILMTLLPLAPALSAQDEWAYVASTDPTLYYVKTGSAGFGDRNGVPTATGVIRSVNKASRKTTQYSVAITAPDCTSKRGTIYLEPEGEQTWMQTDFVIGDKRAISVLAEITCSAASKNVEKILAN